MNYIGIDNGAKSGAIGTLDEDGKILGYWKMPITEDTRRGVCEVDGPGLDELLKEVMRRNCDDIVIGIEQPLPHMQSSQATASCWHSFGVIRAVCEQFILTWRLPTSATVRVQPGNAKDGWQRILGKVPQGRTKEYALATARSLWPGETFILPRGRTPSADAVDALLIAEFIRQQHQ